MIKIFALLIMVTLIVSFALVTRDSFSADNATVSNNTQSSAETSALRAQIEIMRHYDQRLLATVYWSLGVLATITILLIGFGWFANFRLYERDKLALRQELIVFIQEELSKINSTFIANAQSQYDKTLAEARSVGSSAAISLRSELLSEIKNIHGDIKRIQCNMMEAEGESWKKRGILTNAFRSYSFMLGYAIELQDKYLITDALDNIHKIGKLLADKPEDLRPDALDISQLSKSLTKVERDNIIAVNGIRKLLEIIRSK